MERLWISPLKFPLLTDFLVKDDSGYLSTLWKYGGCLFYPGSLVSGDNLYVILLSNRSHLFCTVPPGPQPIRRIDSKHNSPFIKSSFLSTIYIFDGLPITELRRLKYPLNPKFTILYACDFGPEGFSISSTRRQILRLTLTSRRLGPRAKTEQPESNS